MLKKTKEDFFNKIAIKDFKTVEAYRKRIKLWEEFAEKRVGKSGYIPKTKEDSIDIFQLFINWYSLEAVNHRTKKKGHHPNSVIGAAASVRKYLFYRGSPLTKDDVQEHIEMPRKAEKDLRGLKIDEIQTILNSLTYPDKVLFMCQISSGMRIGEIVQLRKKHLILDTERIMVKIPTTIAKFHKARTTFFSKETASVLKPILKKLDDDDLIFTKNTNVKSVESCKGQTLARHLEPLGLNQKYEDSGNNQITTHSFRAYFITKISRHDENLAKLLAGEKGYLLQYDRMSDEEKLENYMDFEKDLLIFDLVRKDEEIKKLRIANTEIAEMKETQLEQSQTIALLREAILGKMKKIS